MHVSDAGEDTKDVQRKVISDDISVCNTSKVWPSPLQESGETDSTAWK